MAFREVGVHEIKVVLRLWLRGEAIRSVARLARVEGKTVRRYVDAARVCRLDRDGGDGQLGDELLSRVAERVRPHRSGGYGESWALLAAPGSGWRSCSMMAWPWSGPGELLAREGVVVPERTLHRYALEVVGHGRASRRATVRVADCEPAAECQVDSASWPVAGPAGRAAPVVQALIFSRGLQPPLLCVPDVLSGPAAVVLFRADRLTSPDSAGRAVRR